MFDLLYTRGRMFVIWPSGSTFLVFKIPKGALSLFSLLYSTGEDCSRQYRERLFQTVFGEIVADSTGGDCSRQYWGIVADSTGEIGADSIGEIVADSTGEIVADCIGEIVVDSTGEMVSDSTGEFVADST